MKVYITCVFLLFCYKISDAQEAERYKSVEVMRYTNKPVVDFSTFDQMDMVLNKVELTNDGNFTAYSVIKKNNIHHLVVQQTRGIWKMNLGILNSLTVIFMFSRDDKYLYWINSDTLRSLDLSTKKIEIIDMVNNLKFPVNNKGEWFGYYLKNTPHSFILFNMIRHERKVYHNVLSIQFHDLGRSLVLKEKTSATDTSLSETLVWKDLSNNTQDTIWMNNGSTKSEIIQFDSSGTQIVFSTRNIEKRERVDIWYYRIGSFKAQLKVDGESCYDKFNARIDGDVGFSRNGKFIYFRTVTNSTELKFKSSLPKVEIWSYKDVYLYPMQEEHRSQFYTCVIDIDSNRVVKVTGENEQLLCGINEIPGEYVITSNSQMTTPSSSKRSYYLVSIRSGKRQMINGIGNHLIGRPSFSPLGKWVTFWDYTNGAHLVCEIINGKLQNLTKGIKNANFIDEFPNGTGKWPVSQAVGWYADDSSVILYDRYDIWKVFIDSSKKAISLTNGYGVKNNIKLRLVFEKDEYGKNIVFKDSMYSILTGFNDVNKENGFFSISLGVIRSLELLTMGPYSYYKVNSQKPHEYYLLGDMPPIVKGVGKDKCYIVRRMSSIESPNFFFSKDLKKFQPLTDFQPQINYKWLKTKLISWKVLDGSVRQGVLYLPEVLEPNKKYPIIFNFYEQLSHRLNEFPYPGASTANINIPWFVSRGYVVFTPDIHYRTATEKAGQIYGESALSSIVSAVKYLKQFPFLDTKRIGLQGHSFGAFQVNYIISHSNLFAAACEMAGDSDPVSSYLTLIGENGNDHHDKQLGVAESGQLRFGATLWDRPDFYLKSSIVLKANTIHTPLMIVHNKKDPSVKWHQGLELYMSLRRLGKPCWMLQYENGGHSVFGRDAEDYTIRMTNFFDHYLKEKVVSKWMTEDNLSRYKGVKDLYEEDVKLKCYSGCKVCNKK